MHPMVQFALRALRGAQEQFVRVRDRLDIAREDNTLDALLADAASRAERHIAGQFARGYPEHGLSGRYIGWQEGRGEGRDYHWKVELFHGYTNLAAGTSGCALSVVCLYKGRPEHAVVISPFTDDEYLISRGRGAHHNDRRMRVPSRHAIDGTRVALGLPESWMRERWFTTWQTLTAQLGKRVEALRASGCPLIDMLELCDGRLDAAFVLGLDEQDLNITSLALKECGALSGTPNGSPQIVEEGALMAASPRLFKQLVQTLGSLTATLDPGPA
ncbi:inositol monophosphatase family protein [Kushneria aurantia]|uniref:Inositol monophosphatase family protein n=1 Tax=Kushneria aurantia TaxID=504092 RepID=A0ABV6G7X5_9GAMM|nr:inositol monophosphatase family protein [Kushneria aurantia]